MKLLITAALALTLIIPAASAQNLAYNTVLKIKPGTSHTTLVSKKKKDKLKFSFNIEFRKPIKVGQKGKILGLKYGFEYDEKFRAGLGYHRLIKNVLRLRKPVENDIVINKGDQDEYTVNSEIKFYHFSPYFEYIILRHKRGELTLPLQIGLGKVNLKYNNINSPYRVGVAAMTLSGYYKLKIWIRIGGSIGYRIMLTDEQIIKDIFNAPIITIKIKFLFKSIFKR